MSRLTRFRESVRFSELAQIHRACSQNWTISCNQISISINILLNTEYSCICCNHTVLVTVKWLTNALRNCSNESVRMNNSFANRTSVKHKGIGWTQCCAAGVSNGGWSAKRPTLHINDFYWNKHSSKINEYVKYIWIIHFPNFRPRLRPTIDYIQFNS